ncbi:zf-HC2 domain-containing protein [Rhodoferax saidenbachensis]|uniref:Putative zinc-finger domain-containing protein n=1 Tax=Rhodoferax saidenbachensis TaxID=1484693 RepID=A0ABU1ZPQ2_9BURK|nr:zf-HC2 domain-containing protein [Rhodoferax saidenbachensis]MDR7307368.1 hypothetical protein [Rhodoferax saidenbachensis]
MMPLRRTCREAAALMVGREDRALGLADRLALRLHLMACGACPKFERQMLAMRNGLRQWRNYAENDDSNGVSPEKFKN